MAGETSAIAQMAEYVSIELFEWFRWGRIPLPDQNFTCVKCESHAPRKDKHTHPVDTVFWYIDPYVNKIVYMNTDLKSYAKGSIDANGMYGALKSLAQTIECARISDEWQTRYHTLGDLPYEVRGLLFVYNHDNEYDNSFYEMLNAPVPRRGAQSKTSIKLDALPVADGQYLHIIEPSLTNYLTTVVTDAQRLHADGTFPEKNYEFYYPDLRLHKASGAKFDRAATAEMLAAPYLIIRHDEVKKYNESTQALDVRFPEGFVIYYNRPGSSAREFAYLLDILSGYQILDGQHKIHLRIVDRKSASDVHSNFQHAIAMYAQEWGFDIHKLSRLKSIEIEVVEVYKYSFSRQSIAWER